MTDRIYTVDDIYEEVYNFSANKKEIADQSDSLKEARKLVEATLRILTEQSKELERLIAFFNAHLRNLDDQAEVESQIEFNQLNKELP
jgi:uncharacterized coiled-coil DUF342 family protein